MERVGERRGRGWRWALAGVLLCGGLVGSGSVQAQQGQQFFPETQHMVKGRFLQYWQEHGRLAQQGYPLTEEQQEVSPTNGRTYTVQYFERAVFEAHPENKAPNDVLLSLLGVFRYEAKYPGGAPNQKASTAAGAQKFAATGHTVGGRFLQYWQEHGGLAQQGYPISEELSEVSDLNGKTYTVQYFERAVFEYHPENAVPNDVLLSQLGKYRLAIAQAREAAGKGGSLRMYREGPGSPDLWPADVGSVTVQYSTCGIQPMQPPADLYAQAAPQPTAEPNPCLASMVLSTALSGSGNDLVVTFSATWNGGASKHAWQVRVKGAQAIVESETGDPLPIMPM